MRLSTVPKCASLMEEMAFAKTQTQKVIRQIRLRTWVYYRQCLLRENLPCWDKQESETPRFYVIRPVDFLRTIFSMAGFISLKAQRYS